jgi:hypothetical protein
VHGSRVAAIVVNDTFGPNPLSKVRPETVDSDIKQLGEEALPPSGRGEVGKVDNGETRLPSVGLKCPSVTPLHEIAFLVAFWEKSGSLADPRVDPHQTLIPLSCNREMKPVGSGKAAGSN